MSVKIYRLEEIDVDRIIYSNADFSHSTTNIYTMYNDPTLGKVPLLFQIPELLMTNPINFINMKCITHELILLFKTKNEKANKVKNFFTNLDNKFIQDGKVNYNKWRFSKDIRYKFLVRDYESNDYKDGIIKLKFVKNKTFQTRVYNKNRDIVNQKNYDNVFRDICYVKSIVELVSLWIKDGYYGAYIRPHQVKVLDEPIKKIKLEKYSFVDDSESEDEICCDTEVPNFNEQVLEQKKSLEDLNIFTSETSEEENIN